MPIGFEHCVFVLAKCWQEVGDEVVQASKGIFASSGPQASGLGTPQIARQIVEHLLIDVIERVHLRSGPAVVTGFWRRQAVVFVKIPLAANGLIAFVAFD